MQVNATTALFGRPEYVELRLDAVQLTFRVREKNPRAVTLRIASPHLRQDLGLSAAALAEFMWAGEAMLAQTTRSGFLGRFRPAKVVRHLTTDLAVDLRGYGPQEARRVTITFQSIPGSTFATLDLALPDFESLLDLVHAATDLSDASLTRHGRRLLADIKEAAAALKVHARFYQKNE